MTSGPGFVPAQQPVPDQQTREPTDHAGMGVMPYGECLRLLATTAVGRGAFPAGGEIVILPVNYAMAEAPVVSVNHRHRTPGRAEPIPPGGRRASGSSIRRYLLH